MNQTTTAPRLQRDHVTAQQRIERRAYASHFAQLGKRHLLHPDNSPVRRTPKPTEHDLLMRWARLSNNGGYAS